MRARNTALNAACFALPHNDEKEMSMKRLLVWSAAGVLVAGTLAVFAVNAAQNRGAVLVPGDNPVSEEQVRTALQAEGWSDVRIQRDGRYFEVMAVKENRPGKMKVDARTGRLASNDDDDDD
jgi:flagellar biosynthesis/type III secretory pathway M-ring protein FliF/YscJ